MKKFKFKSNLLSLVLVLFNFSISTGAKYKCSTSIDSQTCLIDGLTLTRNDYKIEPEAANLSAVTKFKLSGIVPVLSSEICDAMPNLTNFKADNVSMEEIDENTFQECKKLMALNLADNQFVKLERNTFKGLTDLRHLLISGGNVPIIDLDLTDLKQLKILTLNNLSIAVLLPENFCGLENLLNVQLYSNNLFDLDTEGILKHKPKLTNVGLTDNNFKCSRLQEIRSVFEKNNVETPHDAKWKRARSYMPKNVKDIICLSDEQWMSELETTLNTIPPKFFKDLPLEQPIATKSWYTTNLTDLQKNSKWTNSKSSSKYEQKFGDLFRFAGYFRQSHFKT